VTTGKLANFAELNIELSQHALVALLASIAGVALVALEALDDDEKGVSTIHTLGGRQECPPAAIGQSQQDI
jgi:hypothetical protein